jgi:ATP/maltotriose-dependent transcriptional regulator MalT
VQRHVQLPLGLLPLEEDVRDGERLYVSENTVKTHASRLLAKLGARRRTEAVQRAKDAGLLP